MYPLYNLCFTAYQLLMVTIGSEDITIVIGSEFSELQRAWLPGVFDKSQQVVTSTHVIIESEDIT